jgi:Mg2+ and Co2+ transporter CorA
MNKNALLTKELEAIGNTLLSLSKKVRNIKNERYVALSNNEMLSTITEVDTDILTARRKLADVSKVMDTSNVN